jgi:hypothetical protein
MNTIFDLESLLRSKSILYSNCKDIDEAIAIIVMNNSIDIVSFPKQYIFNLTAENTSKVGDAYVFEFIVKNGVDILSVKDIMTGLVGGDVKIEYIGGDTNFGNVSKIPICKVSHSHNRIRLTFTNNPIGTSIGMNTQNLILDNPIRNFITRNKIIIDGVIF